MKKPFRFTVANRLFLGFSALGLGVIAITIISLIAMRELQASMDNIVNDIAPSERVLGRLQTESMNLSRMVSVFFNEQDPDALTKIEMEYQRSKENYQALEQQLAVQVQKFPDLTESAEQLSAMTGEVAAFLENIEASMDEYKTSLGSLSIIQERRAELVELNRELEVSLSFFVSDSFDPSAKELAYETKSIVERGGSLALQMTFVSNLVDFQASQNLFREFSDDYGSLGFRMLGFARNDPTFRENMQEVASLTTQLIEFVSIEGGVSPILNQYLQLRASLQTRLSQIQASLNANVTALNLIDEQFSRLSEQASVDASSARTEARTMLIIAALVVVLLSLAIGYFVVRSIRNPLNQLRQFILKVGQGDLTSSIGHYSADEMGDISQAMDQLVDQIKDVVGDIARQSELVSEVSSKTSELADETSKKSTQQQADIDQSIHSINEMSESIKEVARTAENTSQEMQASESEAQNINDGIATTVDSISNLNLEMQKAVDVIHTLDQGVGSIESILETIQTIAEQTNLLALNAAIEAARAGEQGRGFAVVADEVRTLATRTQTSTEEIREKISSIQKQSTVAVNTISTSQKSTEKVTSTAQTAGEKFSQFMMQIRNLSAANVSIAAAAEEQSATTEQMSRLMRAIGELTKETNGITQEVSTGVRSLNTVSRDLSKAVHRFKTR